MKRLLSLLVIVALIACNSVIVFADTNTDKNTAGEIFELTKDLRIIVSIDCDNNEIIHDIKEQLVNPAIPDDLQYDADTINILKELGPGKVTDDSVWSDNSRCTDLVFADGTTCSVTKIAGKTDVAYRTSDDVIVSYTNGQKIREERYIPTIIRKEIKEDVSDFISNNTAADICKEYNGTYKKIS